MADVLFPLEGCENADPLKGGFGFLEPIGDGQGTLHPGVDLNAGSGGDADCGQAVICPAPGVVRARVLWDGVTKGFGSHVWIEHESGAGQPSVWTHYCHLATAPVPVGTRLAAGDVFATCGKSGGWPWCHTHFEVRRTPPPAWDYWPAGQSRAQVAADYLDPLAWLRSLAQEDEMAVSEEDQRILDTVHGLGADADSIVSWINELGADKQVIDQLTQQIAQAGGRKLVDVQLVYDDGSVQDATPAA